MNDTKVVREVEALNRFMRMMEVDPDRAYYGFAHVSKAQEHLAVDTLLLTDQLFRSSNVKARKEYVTLVEEARAVGGESNGDEDREKRKPFCVLTCRFHVPKMNCGVQQKFLSSVLCTFPVNNCSRFLE